MNLNLDIRRTLALFIGVCNAGVYSTLRAIQETTGDDTVLVQTHDGRAVWKASDSVPRMQEVVEAQQRAVRWAEKLIAVPDDDLVPICSGYLDLFGTALSGIARSIGDGWNPRTTALETPTARDWELFVHADRLLWKLEDLVGIADGTLSGTVVWFTKQANLPPGLKPEERYVATILEDDRFQIDTDDGKRVWVSRSEPHYTTPVTR